MTFVSSKALSIVEVDILLRNHYTVALNHLKRSASRSPRSFMRPSGSRPSIARQSFRQVKNAISARSGGSCVSPGLVACFNEFERTLRIRFPIVERETPMPGSEIADYLAFSSVRKLCTASRSPWLLAAEASTVAT
jgi:hypothetical protein